MEKLSPSSQITAGFFAMCAGRAVLMMIDRSSRKEFFAVRYTG